MPTAGEVIRLVIVEDHVLVREGLIEILQTYEDLEVVGAAGHSGSAVPVVAKQKPDTVILDVEIPGDEVTTTVGRIQEVSPGTKILVLSMYDGPELVRHLLGLGVKGYLLKNATRHELVAAIRGAHADDGRIVLFVSRESLAHVQDGSSATLSARERDVLELVALGMSNAQVASRLSLTEATVKRHLRNTFVKLGAVSRIDAVNKAVAASQISPRRPEARRPDGGRGVASRRPTASHGGDYRRAPDGTRRSPSGAPAQPGQQSVAQR